MNGAPAFEPIRRALVEGRPPQAVAWNRFLRAFHDGRPALTEAFFAAQPAADGSDGYGWLVESAALTAGASVLDLGCGSAPMAGVLGAAVTSRGRVVGLDASRGELLAARQRFPALEVGDGPGQEGPTLLQGSAGALPLSDGSMDAVVASMVLMLLAPLQPALAEIARVLRPGGRLVASVEGTALRWRDELRLTSALLSLRRWIEDPLRPLYPHPEALNTRALTRALSAEGLEVTSVDERRFPVRLDDERAARALWDATYYSVLLPQDALEALRDAAARWVARGAVELHMPVRRIVAIKRPC